MNSIKTRGFGYSFSNAKLRGNSDSPLDGGNLPYFVVSSVNDDYNGANSKQDQEDNAFVLDFFCLNLRENCKSKATSSKTTLNSNEDFTITITLPEHVTQKEDVELTLKDV